MRVLDVFFFHLAQSHWRKLTDRGLRQRYIEDGTLSLSLRMFTALAFVPPEDMDSVFKELIENTPEEAHDMIPYMENTYIGSSTYAASQQKPDGSMIRQFLYFVAFGYY